MGKIFQTLMFCLLLVFLISIVGAVQTYEQGSVIDIKKSVRVDGGIPNSAVCNISIFYPNSTTLIDYQEMQDQTNFFNYTLSSSQTNIKGEYNYDITCFQGGLNETASDGFLINLGGIEPNQQRTDAVSRTIYIFFGLAVMCLIGVVFVNKLPFRVTLGVVMVWFLLIGINTSYLAIQDEIVNSKIESFFSFFLTASFIINWGLFYALAIFWVVIFFVNLFNFRRLKKESRYSFDE